MNDLRRLFPEGFLETYYDTLGVLPPIEILEAYQYLCNALYFGIRQPDEGGVKGARRHRHQQQYFFRTPNAFFVKRKVDRRLASLAFGLRKWAAASPRAGSHREAPRAAGGADLAGARGHGDRSAGGSE